MRRLHRQTPQSADNDDYPTASARKEYWRGTACPTHQNHHQVKKYSQGKQGRTVSSSQLLRKSGPGTQSPCGGARDGPQSHYLGQTVPLPAHSTHPPDPHVFLLYVWQMRRRLRRGGANRGSSAPTSPGSRVAQHPARNCTRNRERCWRINANIPATGVTPMPVANSPIRLRLRNFTAVEPNGPWVATVFPLTSLDRCLVAGPTILPTTKISVSRDSTEDEVAAGSGMEGNGSYTVLVLCVDVYVLVVAVSACVSVLCVGKYLPHLSGGRND